MKPLDLENITKQFSKKLKRLPAESAAMPHPLNEGKLLTQSDLDELHQEIELLGKTFKLNLTQLPPKQVPALNAQMPNVDYKAIRVYEVTRALDSLYSDLDGKFIPFDDETVVQFSEDMAQFIVTYNSATYTFTTPPDLKEHIQMGSKAYLHFQFRQGFVKWVSEIEGNLRMAWVKERDDFGSLSTITHDAFIKVKRVKTCAMSYQQYCALNQTLPFAWNAATRPVRGGLSGSTKSSGNGSVSNTVVHLLVQEDVKIGRLTRAKGDFLCAPSKGRLARDLGPYDAVITVEMNNGDVYSKVPQLITCQDCLEKLETIKNKVKG